VLDPHARGAAEAELSSRFDPNSAVDDGVVRADEDGRAEADSPWMISRRRWGDVGVQGTTRTRSDKSPTIPSAS